VSENYDPHELRIIKRGVSIDKVIAAYKHFGSFRPVAKVCNISKDTVRHVILRYNISNPNALLPSKASYNPKNLYSDFAKWHKAHVEDTDLPRNLADLAKLAGVEKNTAKCYFYRRRREARKILHSLPDLRDLSLSLEDIEGHVFQASGLEHYRYAIDRYSQKAVLQGTLEFFGEVTVLIPSIDRFASRVRKKANEKQLLRKVP